MLYYSWDMARDGCNYFSFWAIFCTFTPQQPEKSKLKKITKKTPGDLIILHKCIKNHDHILYCSWDMVRDRCNCYFSAQQIQILKKWKEHLEISSFYICVPKTMIRWCTVPEIWCRTDGQKKWHIEVGAPPKKKKRNGTLGTPIKCGVLQSSTLDLLLGEGKQNVCKTKLVLFTSSKKQLNNKKV